MSEQVKRYSLSEFAEQHTHPVGPGTYVEATDYDALHAEAEALRAENGRLQSACDHNKTCAQVANELADQLAAELESARGLLRECRDTVSLAHDLAETQVEGEKYSALGWKITAFLTATQAPEVPDHLRHSAKMAEQGERQEAVCRLNTATALVQRMVECAGAQPSVATGYLRDILDVLKGGDSDQQPGPDVRSLIEAASAYLNALDSGAHDYDVKRARHNLRHELAAHRQAQRQA
ncbi:hypothetical protein H3221_013610 [Pseudomonas sp. LMG 31766]|uniref:Uncharacterized protein n=1 Tax=Pseudomonas chaetocerotis TaxID=2758695 RepID=A0A931GAF9_9PSED|nr:hypothetical protein [Pseudomonas chaetocerotis]MBZ9665789.1 hypothetical protein [Pseudomonas chaetocerotis]